MNEKPRIIQGTPAMLLLVGGGVASLGLAGYELRQADPSGRSVLFIIGLACGYLAPFTLRVAGALGRARMRRSRSLRIVFLTLVFLSLLSPVFGAVTNADHGGEIFKYVGGGVLTMVLLGFGLVDVGSDPAAA